MNPWVDNLLKLRLTGTCSFPMFKRKKIRAKMTASAVLPVQLNLEEAMASCSENQTAVSIGLHVLMAMVLKFTPCTGIR